MGEKLYRPILKEGDHLVRSKDNEGRVRGVSQDENNKTTDIVEWEEVEIDEPQYEYPIEQYEQERVKLTPEQQQLAQAVGEIVIVKRHVEKVDKRNCEKRKLIVQCVYNFSIRS